jgi:hypothetical protein
MLVSGFVVSYSCCILMLAKSRQLLSILKPDSGSYLKSGFTSMLSWRSLSLRLISVVTSPSLSIESLLCCSIISFDYSWISLNTLLTSSIVLSISLLCNRRKAMFPAWRYTSKGRTLISFSFFYSSITLFFLALSNLKVLDYFLSEPISILFFTIIQRLLFYFYNFSKKFNLL